VCPVSTGNGREGRWGEGLDESKVEEEGRGPEREREGAVARVRELRTMRRG
jgi:hypothetical protein